MGKKKKKNRKALNQRRLKAQQRKAERRKRMKAEERRSEQSRHSLGPDMVLTRPPMAEMEAPEGFRPIGLAQAMVTFARPLMDAAEAAEGVDMNEALQLGTAIWNYGIAQERGRDSIDMRLEIVRQLQRVFGLTLQEAIDRLEEMVERKRFLFPSDVESPSPMVMFMRKETAHQISEFDYGALKLQDEPVGSDEADRSMVAKLRNLDRKIDEGVDYSDWEDEFFDLKEVCGERFLEWLQQKGAGEEARREFPSCVDIYLDFVYGYMHSGNVTLREIPTDDMEEFFSDYLLRKVTVEPQEYTFWPPALRLFYRFLVEKEYLADAGLIIGLLDRFEPRFLDILRKQFG